MRVGDRVEIINFLKEYTTYEEWVSIHAPSYLNEYMHTSIDTVVQCCSCEQVWHYRELVNEEYCPECLSFNWVDGYIDEDGSMLENLEGVIVAKAPHGELEGRILYLVELDSRIVLIEKGGIRTLEKTFYKSNLKTGMVVKTRENKIFLVVKDTMQSHKEYNPLADRILSLSDYDDTLKSKISSNFDIIEIRQLNSISDIFNLTLQKLIFDYNDFKMLWVKEKDTQCIVGVHFGSEEEYIWKSPSIDCAVGDIVRVETSYGNIELAKVKSIFYTNQPSAFLDVIGRLC